MFNCHEFRFRVVDQCIGVCTVVGVSDRMENKYMSFTNISGYQWRTLQSILIRIYVPCSGMSISSLVWGSFYCDSPHRGLQKFFIGPTLLRP